MGGTSGGGGRGTGGGGKSRPFVVGSSVKTPHGDTGKILSLAPAKGVFGPSAKVLVGKRKAVKWPVRDLRRV